MNLSSQKPIANPSPTDAFRSFALCDTAQKQAASLGLLVPSKIPDGTFLSICGNAYTVTGGVGVCSGGQTTGNLLLLPWFPSSIGSRAFNNCSGFNGSLVLPNSVTSIGTGAFYGCSGFNGSLVLPNSLTSIGTYAFNNCSGFTGSLVLPNSLTSIETGAFYNCSGFTGSLVLPNSLTSIGSNAFAYCSGFTGSLTLPSTLTSVGTYAFQSNPRLPAVYADMDASNVASTAFASCASLTTIYVSPTAANWGSLPGTWNGIATAEWTNYPSIP